MQGKICVPMFVPDNMELVVTDGNYPTVTIIFKKVNISLKALSGLRSIAWPPFFLICRHGHHNNIDDSLHIQKYLLGDSLHGYSAFIKKCTVLWVCRCTTLDIPAL